MPDNYTVEPRELVVISGKGGTGKTSIVASFASLATKLVLADCDVDAADLHLVLEPRVRQRHDFSGGKRARIDSTRCTNCGKCRELCRFDAIRQADSPGAAFSVDPITCEGCGVCAWFCPNRAIEFGPAVNGEWYVSDTRYGPMVHAKLGVAEENSGKLVSIVRKEALAIAQRKGTKLVLIDGSPGIGCPVIASIAGAAAVLIVTEPTLSGLHDMDRVSQLTKHFNVPAMVCVNKWDLNPQVCDSIERQARERGLVFAGKVRYSRAVTEAQIHKRPVVEHHPGGCGEDIRDVWSAVSTTIAAD